MYSGSPILGHGVGPVVSRVKEQESSVQFLKPLNQVLKDDPRVGGLDKNNDFASTVIQVLVLQRHFISFEGKNCRRGKARGGGKVRLGVHVCVCE